MPDLDDDTRTHASNPHARLQSLEHHRRAHAAQLQDHALRILATEKSLADGRVSHTEMRAEIQSVDRSLKELITRLDANRDDGWLIDLRRAAIFWGVPLLGGGLLWAISSARAAGAL